MVLADGTVRGLVENELPVSRLRAVLAKLGQNNPQAAEEVQEATEKALATSLASFLAFPSTLLLAVVCGFPSDEPATLQCSPQDVVTLLGVEVNLKHAILEGSRGDVHATLR